MRLFSALIFSLVLSVPVAQAFEVDYENEIKNDITCVSKDVFDAGFLVLGDLTSNNTLSMKIEAVNNWTGNTIEYHQDSEIINMAEDGFCASVVVDNSSNPATVVVISEDASLEKLNGKEVPKFTDLNCVVSPRMHRSLTCAH